MKATIRYLVCVLMLVVLLQALLTAATYHYAASRSMVDTYDASSNVYQRSAKMAVYGTSLIAKQSAKPQLIILGSSDALLGLRPKKLSELTQVNVHNLAVAQHNIKSLTRLLDLLYQQTPRENWPNLNIIVAVSGTSFKSDKLKWAEGLTDVDQETLRHGAFRRTRLGVAPQLGERNISMMFNATLPFMVPFAVYCKIMEYVFTDSKWHESIRKVLPKEWRYEQWFPSDAKTDANPPFTLAQRHKYLSYINEFYMGKPETWSDTGLQQAEQMAVRVSAAGGHFFYIDLPNASWWQKGLNFHAYYQKYKRPYIARMKAMPRVHYINLQQGFSDNDFYDGAHTRARVRPEIARRVAEPINRALALQKANKE